MPQWKGVSRESGKCEHRRKSQAGERNYNRCVCMPKSSEGNLWESVLYLTQVMRLGGMHLYLLSHLAGPEFVKDLKHKSQVSRWLNKLRFLPVNLKRGSSEIKILA